ncbi:hypothetical protein QA601_10285 [Chitinispirillales bacterium ANBcel5]|uniref:hypothetical protein n=1 Tax=Cellulosispirillum alkaliphilum TaxID=3039283 RepID=UPI002A54349C|nr:hypothetical protein [Chitinispirillales bacterium ANBcel5]
MSGEVIFSVQSSTTSNIDDIGEACRNLAQQIVKRNKDISTSDKSARVEVRPKDTFSINHGIKIISKYSYYDNLKLSPIISFGYQGKIQTHYYFVEYFAGPFFPSIGHIDTVYDYGSGINFSLGAAVIAPFDMVFPYIGAGLNPKVLFSSSLEASTLSIYSLFDISFFESFPIQLNVEGRLAFALTPINIADDSIRPREFSVAFGFGW